MFQLYTARLRLIPLDLAHLRLLLEDRQRLERELGLAVTDVVLEGPLRRAVESHMLPNVARDPRNTCWYTDWQIVVRAENCIVGGFCFKGPPNAAGEVELGYGLLPGHRGRGYMTEALREGVRWAFGQPGVEAVTAEIERENLASVRVVQRLDMVPYAEKGPFVYWRLSKTAWASAQRGEAAGPVGSGEVDGGNARR